MALPFPYTYYSCPCADTRTTSKPQGSRSAEQSAIAAAEEEDDEEDATFDPHSPRADFSLFPLEHLLYCTECHQIRCTRCIAEEVVCWYCPSCLFEVPSSTVRSEGARCTRSCYNCPVCTSFMSVAALESPGDESSEEGPKGPFILTCSYCMWTSLDIGIKFSKSNNITSQLATLKNGGGTIQTAREREENQQRRGEDEDDGILEEADHEDADPTDEEMFSRLDKFYKQQIDDAAENGLYGTGTSDLNHASPSSINRLLNMYATGRRPKPRKPMLMRSACVPEEGLQPFDPSSELPQIQALRQGGWESTSSRAQLAFQPSQSSNSARRQLSSLRPVPTLLRTKRSKRCKTCRTLLSRPEPKISTTRYKIRVLASQYLPTLTLRALSPPHPSATLPAHPLQLLPAADASLPYTHLQPLKPYLYILTLTNPLFDRITVSLATPATTPGRVQSRLTILCPSFDVGANTDVWDEALTSSAAGRRTSLLPSAAAASPDETRPPEVGKIWDKGRNWTSVVLEVIPGELPRVLPAVVDKKAPHTSAPLPDTTSTEQAPTSTSTSTETETEAGAETDNEDEDVLEIPVYVQISYDTEVSGAGAGAAEKRDFYNSPSPFSPSPGTGAGTGAGRERRELGFWSVLGAGRIRG